MRESLEFFICNVAALAIETEEHVITKRVVEQRHALFDETDLFSEFLEVKEPKVVPVDEDSSSFRIISAYEQIHDGGLARSGFADERNVFSGIDLETDCCQCRGQRRGLIGGLVLLVDFDVPNLRIRERDVLEFDCPFELLGTNRVRNNGHRRGNVEDCEILSH